MKNIRTILQYSLSYLTRLMTASLGVAALFGAAFGIPALGDDNGMVYTFSNLLALGGLIIYLNFSIRKASAHFRTVTFWLAAGICAASMFFVLCASAYWEYRPGDSVPFLVSPLWLGGESLEVQFQDRIPSSGHMVLRYGLGLWADAIFSWPSLLLFAFIVVPEAVKSRRLSNKKTFQSSCVYKSGDGAEETTFGPAPETSPEDINSCG